MRARGVTVRSRATDVACSVCLSVCLSVRLCVYLCLCQHVSLLDITVRPTKTDEPIEIDDMPFELWTRMGPRNHVLDGGANTSRGSNLGGGLFPH